MREIEINTGDPSHVQITLSSRVGSRKWPTSVIPSPARIIKASKVRT